MSLIQSIEAGMRHTWGKYDKNITSVLRTMNFNSVKAYTKSSPKVTHYYQLVEDLKINPNSGATGLGIAVNDLISSTKFKSLMWIEENVSRYILAKKGATKLRELAETTAGWFLSLKEIPGVYDVEVSVSTSDELGVAMMDKKKDANIFLRILYKPSLIIARDANPYEIIMEKPIYNIFKLTLPTTLDPEILETGNLEDFKRSLISKRLLRDSFAFGGPCMYSPSTGGRTQSNREYPAGSASLNVTRGCLGNRNDDFNEVLSLRSIEAFIAFATSWATVYTKNSNPYQSISSLVDSGWRFMGLTNERALKLIGKTNSSGTSRDYCAVYRYVHDYNKESYRALNKEVVLGHQEKHCPKCIITNCNFHADQLLQNSVAKSKAVSESEGTRNIKDEIKKILVLHEKLIHDSYADMPIMAQIECLKDEYSNGYLKDNFSDFMLKVYRKSLQAIKEFSPNEKKELEELWKQTHTKEEEQ